MVPPQRCGSRASHRGASAANVEISSSDSEGEELQEQGQQGQQRGAFRPRTLSSARAPGLGSRHHSSSSAAVASSASSSASSTTPAAHHHRSSRPRVLVTGGAGFIGSHVARALLLRGEDVAIVDELNDYYDPALKVANLRALLEEFGQRRVHVHVADVCDLPAMESLFASEKPDRVVHLAARAGVRPSIQDPLLYEQSNIRGTLTLLTLTKKFNIEHFVTLLLRAMATITATMQQRKARESSSEAPLKKHKSESASSPPAIAPPPADAPLPSLYELALKLEATSAAVLVTVKKVLRNEEQLGELIIASANDRQYCM